MKMKHLLTIAVAAVLAFAAVNVNAQSIVMSGSSGIYLELGQASTQQPLTGSAILNCGWSDGSKTFTLTDSRPTELAEGDAALTDANNNAWVTWTISGGTCTTATAAQVINVNLMVSVDSSVGNRCFFANPSCTVHTSVSAGTNGAGTIANGTFTESAIPQVVINVINTPLSLNASGTDIRPEDSLFATLRGFQGCGWPMATGSQYLGTGYQTEPTGYGAKAVGLVGTALANGGVNGDGGSALNLAKWALSGNDPFAAAAGLTKNAPAFTVQSVGAVPVVIMVNPANDAGLGSLAVTNIDSGILAGFLDGSFQRVTDMIPQGYSAGAGEAYTFVREFLSGTYNTTEFNVTNTQSNQSSMDVGVAAVNAAVTTADLPPLECNGTPSATQITNGGGLLKDSSTPFGNYYRSRTIGTGAMVTSIKGRSDSLGYAFWSAANFSGVSATNGKYLTVDGVDPLQEVWQDGLVPTSGNGLLANVSLSHVRDGSYPIWSILRVVCGSNCTATNALITSAVNFVGPSQPDFIPLVGTNVPPLKLVRSHFAPPTVTMACSTPSNGNTAAGENAECGGDVGGVVYTLQADGDYAADASVTPSVGEVGHRR